MNTNINNGTNLQPGQWLDERGGYIAGGSLKTDLPQGAVERYSVVEEYCKDSNQTYVYETWVCE